MRLQAAGRQQEPWSCGALHSTLTQDFSHIMDDTVQVVVGRDRGARHRHYQARPAGKIQCLFFPVHRAGGWDEESADTVTNPIADGFRSPLRHASVHKLACCALLDHKALLTSRPRPSSMESRARIYHIGLVHAAHAAVSSADVEPGKTPDNHALRQTLSVVMEQGDKLWERSLVVKSRGNADGPPSLRISYEAMGRLAHSLFSCARSACLGDSLA